MARQNRRDISVIRWSARATAADRHAEHRAQKEAHEPAIVPAMKPTPARPRPVVYILLFAATLTVPIYVLMDRYGLVPVALRDRPWPFVLGSVLLSWIAWRISPRLRWVSALIALLSSSAIGWAAHVRYRLPPSSMAGVGAPLPDFALHDESGNLVRLRALSGQPLVLVWFRGSWCPYCRRQLSELQTELLRFAPGTLRILAVAADPPEPLAVLKRDLRLSFPILSDPERRLVNACELGHCVAIVDAEGIVRWAVLSGNWQKDLPARALLQSAYRQR